MVQAQHDILARLKRQILPLQGLVRGPANQKLNIGWGRIDNAFPNRQFPIAATHEFMCNGPEQVAASTGFIAPIVRALAGGRGVCACVTHTTNIFAHGLAAFGIQPENILFIDIKKKKDILWALEELLQSDGLTAVIAEVPELDFTASRRLQLAVEKSKSTGFMLRPTAKNIPITASVSRWRITALPSEMADGLPGVGDPRWNVELLKIRNGQPGSWQLQWRNHQFEHIDIEKEIHRLPPVPLLATVEQQTG